LGKLKFGVFIPFYAFKTEEPKEHFSQICSIVLECEKLGYHSVWLDDHLMYNDWPILECWTTLSALSSLTSKIRLGTMVTCSSHRNPALLAKMAATLDVLSGGRLEFGVGAGIQDSEHLSYGFDFPQPSERIERLAEGLEVIRRLWTQERANYEGKHYALKNAVCEPKPLQKPHPPITVGGSGQLLLRKVTAPYANRLDFGYLPSIESYKRKLELLEKQCKKIGRDFGEIEKACWPCGQVLIARNQSELGEKIVQKNVMDLPLEEFKKTTLAGTPDECIARIQVYVDLGVTYFMLFFADLPSLNGLRLFAANVTGKIG
jgi:alkanesulfonate monooxygenase SsuD/methylene tetrahydromethanopterin reductase-like flavin-dependent oxidoreductase (luciferase family)